jgi:hypothetical protein
MLSDHAWLVRALDLSTRRPPKELLYIFILWKAALASVEAWTGWEHYKALAGEVRCRMSSRERLAQHAHLDLERGEEKDGENLNIVFKPLSVPA